jgi:translation initiation factor RLI1
MARIPVKRGKNPGQEDSPGNESIPVEVPVCDSKCPAEAMYEVTFPGNLILHFCGHHYNDKKFELAKYEVRKLRLWDTPAQDMRFSIRL